MRKSRRQIHQEWVANKYAKKPLENPIIEEPSEEAKTTLSFEKEETSVDSSLLEEDASELEHQEKSSRTKTRRVKSNASSEVKDKPKKFRKFRKPKK